MSVFTPSIYLESTGAIPFSRPADVANNVPPPGLLELNGSYGVKPRAAHLSFDERLALAQGERIIAGTLTAINLHDDGSGVFQIEAPQETYEGAGIQTGILDSATGESTTSQDIYSLPNAGKPGYTFDPATFTFVEISASPPSEPATLSPPVTLAATEPIVAVEPPAVDIPTPVESLPPSGCETHLLNAFEEVSPGVYAVVSEHLGDDGTYSYVVQL